MLICYSIELKITLIIFNFKKKKNFSYPDNGSNRIFFIRIIIRIETALSGYPKKKIIRVNPVGPGYGSKHYYVEDTKTPFFAFLKCVSIIWVPLYLSPVSR